MAECPKCGRENHKLEKICVYCGESIIDISQRTATRKRGDTDYQEGEPRYGSPRFGVRATLSLKVVGTNDVFSFDADEIEELSIGRADPKTGSAPGVDLNKFDALDKGVSRDHAAIICRDGALYIMDKGTPNGTFLNGQKLVAHQPRVLRDGDEIRLSHLSLQIAFFIGNPK